MKIVVADELKNSCPQFMGIAILATVKNSDFNADLWQDIDLFIEQYRAKYTIEEIKKNSAIDATRQAYKTLGKDPNRYRPSSESLCRRIVKEKSLYKVNTLVDLINLVSMSSGYSISGFDINKVEGDVLTLGIGKADEPYEGIGRGLLNIEFLPVYRDLQGGIGTPTSDNERTKLDADSIQMLTIINSFNGIEGLDAASKNMIDLLKKYADAKISDHFFF